MNISFADCSESYFICGRLFTYIMQENNIHNLVFAMPDSHQPSCGCQNASGNCICDLATTQRGGKKKKKKVF